MATSVNNTTSLKKTNIKCSSIFVTNKWSHIYSYQSSLLWPPPSPSTTANFFLPRPILNSRTGLKLLPTVKKRKRPYPLVSILILLLAYEEPVASHPSSSSLRFSSLRRLPSPIPPCYGAPDGPGRDLLPAMCAGRTERSRRRSVFVAPPLSIASAASSDHRLRCSAFSTVSASSTASSVRDFFVV